MTITLSSTLIGGKGGPNPSSLHTTLERPTEYVNARRMYSLHGFLHGIKLIIFHGHLHYVQKPSVGGRSSTKLGTMALHTLATVDLFYFIMCEDLHE